MMLHANNNNYAFEFDKTYTQNIDGLFFSGHSVCLCVSSFYVMSKKNEMWAVKHAGQWLGQKVKSQGHSTKVSDRLSTHGVS